MNKSDFYYEENLERQLKALQQENDTLKQTHDYDLKMIDEVKCNSSKVLKENRQLKEQLDQATKSTINSHKYASNTEDRLIELEEQLKQRNEVIVEIREYCNSEKFFIRMGEPQISVNGVTKYELVRNDILQIIDKYMKEDDTN